MKRTFVAACFLGCVWSGCSGSSSGGGDGGPAEAGPCSGNMVPAGSTCLTPSGTCEAMVCEGSAWGCPGNDRQIALTATNCPNGVAGADAGQD